MSFRGAIDSMTPARRLWLHARQVQVSLPGLAHLFTLDSLQLFSQFVDRFLPLPSMNRMRRSTPLETDQEALNQVGPFMICGLSPDVARAS